MKNNDDTSSNAANYESIASSSLCDIPVVISLDDNSFTLAAVILFSPPSAGLGHFTAAIRINDKFEVFDDLRQSTYTIDNKLTVCVHSLLYTMSSN